MVRLVLTTFAAPEEAARVARVLVGENLAACGTVLPGARSIYSWNGRIEDTTETVLLIKTTAAQFPALEKRLTALHPYETPEIIALDPEAVSPAYARWVEDLCSGSSPQKGEVEG